MSTTHRCPNCGAPVPKEAGFCQECGKQTAQRSGLPARSIGVAIVALIALAGVLFAGLQAARPEAAAPVPAKEDPTQIAGVGPMPVWLLSADWQVREDYIWASTHLEELQYIPCYCGCGPIGHVDNFGCYFKRDQKGVITGYDDHAVG